MTRIRICMDPYWFGGSQHYLKQSVSFKGTVRTVSGDFRLLVFFMNQFRPSPWVPGTPLGPFRIFPKFAEIFAAQGAPLVSLIPVVHLYLRLSPQMFEKIQNGPNGTLWERHAWKRLTCVRAPRARAEMVWAQHIVGMPRKDPLLSKVVS